MKDLEKELRECEECNRKLQSKNEGQLAVMVFFMGPFFIMGLSRALGVY